MSVSFIEGVTEVFINVYVSLYLCKLTLSVYLKFTFILSVFKKVSCSLNSMLK